jgi:hypothetical protein
VPIDPDLIDWRERRYVSQYSPEPFGLLTGVAGTPSNADGSVTAELMQQLPDGSTTSINTYTATNTGVGEYEVTLSSADTSAPGDFALEWAWTIASQPQTYVIYLVVGQANQNYDNLSPDMKGIVDGVWFRFADLFDSPAGGPNLQTYYQTHFSRGRMAQLMAVGLGLLNTMAQPHTTYTIDGQGGSVFPVAQWGPLLSTATYVEALKHLIRSYVEQPMVMGGGSITRLDRRDYLQRWQSVLQMEEVNLKSQLDVFKLSAMSLGRPKVLVSGGVYGRYGPTRVAGSVAARPRYWARFFS